MAAAPKNMCLVFIDESSFARPPSNTMSVVVVQTWVPSFVSISACTCHYEGGTRQVQLQRGGVVLKSLFLQDLFNWHHYRMIESL